MFDNFHIAAFIVIIIKKISKGNSALILYNNHWPFFDNKKYIGVWFNFHIFQCFIIVYSCCIKKQKPHFSRENFIILIEFILKILISVLSVLKMNYIHKNKRIKKVKKCGN